MPPSPPSRRPRACSRTTRISWRTPSDEANRIVDDARQSGEAVKGDICRTAEGEADQIKDRARDEIASERERVSADLQRQVADLSLDVAEKVVAGSLDRESQQALVDQYIDELGGVQ